MLNPVTDDFLQTLKSALPEQTFRPVEPRYIEEPRGRYTGVAGTVLAPKTTAEVSHILAACNAARVAVLPLSGGTGLVGGQVAEHLPAPVILSLERMNKVRGVNAHDKAMDVEAGVVLTRAQEAADELGKLFPLSLASEGSARIGGLLSTNAGGVNVLRYGNARDLVLGIEAVLADGTVVHGLKRLRKDNTGYDLRHLMIGAEGTLGIITAASLRLFAKPQSQATAMLAVPSPKAALELLDLAGERIGEAVSAFEMMSRMGLDFLEEAGHAARAPFDTKPDWFVLIEVGFGAGQDAERALEDLFAVSHEAGIVTDGVIAQSLSQRQAFWQLRETIPWANRKVGGVSHHDISMPISAIPDFIAQAPAVLAKIDGFRINCFGHVGDGNLHYNVFPQYGKTREDHAHQREEIKRAVHDLVDQFDGSVSAEHGIGRLKVDDLERYGDPGKLTAMRAIKAALDPNGIMNPGAVLRM